LSLPKYRLQPVLDKRQKIKEDAEKALGAAQKKLDEEKKKEEECIQLVNQAKQRKEEAKAEMSRKMLEEKLDVEIKNAEEKLDEQRTRVKAAEQVVVQRRNELVEATKEYQAIEKHKEKWATSIKKEMEEAEQKEAEEIGNVLFLQRKKE
jgi:flagellar export protein FliJ